MSLWLGNATVVDPAGAGPVCWVELTPTGAVRPSDDPPPDGPVLDGTGIELKLTPHAGLARALLAAIIHGDRAAADLADGYVQRTAYQVVDHAGSGRTFDAMMRVWVRGGRITRVEEYSAGDPTPAGPA